MAVHAGRETPGRFRFCRAAIKKPVILLFTALLVPGTAIFCLHWSASEANQELSFQGPAEPEGWIQKETGLPHGIPESLPPVANPRYTWQGEGFGVFSKSSYGMLAANDDPYLQAFAAGKNEGKLVIQSRDGGVPILGPQLPARFSSRMSDREILDALQGTAGGSFRSFFDKLFGSADADLASQSESQGNQENPFSRIKESLAENKAAEKTDSTQGDAKSDKSSSSQTATKDTQASVQPPSPTAANISKSYLMLQAAEDGALSIVGSSELASGAAATSATASEWNVVPFPGAPDSYLTMAVADFNGDGILDYVYGVHGRPYLRFFYGSEDGTYQEGLRLTIGTERRSLAAGDFDGDGRMDLAMSGIGTGLVTVLYGDPDSLFRWKSSWSDTYRDYITASDPRSSGHSNLIGMTYDNHGSILVDFSNPESKVANNTFDFMPALQSKLASATGEEALIQAVTYSSGLSVNMDNWRGQMVNVINVAPRSKATVIVGDTGGGYVRTMSLATSKVSR